MTMRFNLNVAIGAANSGPEVMYEWISFMTTASPVGPGWTLKSGYNDTAGTTFTSATDMDTYVSTKTPWFVLQDPGGGREILACMSTTDNEEWEFWYSISAGFTGGASGTRATATDEKFIGGGPSGEITGIVDCIWHYAADDASPYGFWFAGYQTGWAAQSGLAMIPISQPIAGDLDPIVFFWNDYNPAVYGAWRMEYASYIRNDSPTLYTGAARGYLEGAWEIIPALFYALYAGAYQIHVPDLGGQDASLNDNPLPVGWARSSGFTPPTGFKGFTDWIYWQPNDRATGSTLDSKNWIVFGDFLLPWDGSTVPATP